VVFTDLDGTILDEKYDWRSVQPMISELLALDAAVVFCSSKTRAEIEFYRKAIGIGDPFAVENGSAIFIPKGYFTTSYAFSRQTYNYNVIELGVPYSAVRKALTHAKRTLSAEIVGFGDMTVVEAAKETGLPLRLARLAKQREYDEPFQILKGDEQEVLTAIGKEGLSCTRGNRYFHAFGNTDKGKATAALRDLYAREFGEIATFGVGDSHNDLPMLKEVDTPFFIREGEHENTRVAVWRKILCLVAGNGHRH